MSGKLKSLRSVRSKSNISYSSNYCLLYKISPKKCQVYVMQYSHFSISLQHNQYMDVYDINL